MEISVEKKRKSRHLGINTHYTTKNRKSKQLQLGNNSRCLDKKKQSQKNPKYQSRSMMTFQLQNQVHPKLAIGTQQLISTKQPIDIQQLIDMQGLSICVVDESQENLEITVHKKGLRYDNRTLFDTLERIEKKLDKLVGNGMVEIQLQATER
ncbi:hypothetical protein QTP88_020362 [Uroleucon formosanum]